MSDYRVELNEVGKQIEVVIETDDLDEAVRVFTAQCERVDSSTVEVSLVSPWR